MSNIRRSIVNIAASAGSQLLTILVGLVVPRLILLHLGSETNGLVSSVTQLLGYLALLEAGVGAASVQALYRPVADGNRSRIREILSASARFYRRTTVAYVIAVLLLTLGYPLFVRSELPRAAVMGVVALNGFSGAISFYFQGKYRILLLAEGKNYLLSLLDTAASLLCKLFTLLLLLGGFGLIAVQAAVFLVRASQVLCLCAYMRRGYPWLDFRAKPDMAAISQRGGALVHQLAELVFYHTDTLLLTLFCDLKTVSVYAMYSTLFGVVRSALGTIHGADFAMGQLFQSDREAFLRAQDLYEPVYLALTYGLFSIAAVCMTPFLRRYTAGVEDVNYVIRGLPFLFALNLMLGESRAPCGMIIGYAGLYRETQLRVLAGTVINLGVSLLLVRPLGIAGVLLGTIAALLYRFNDVLLYANRRILHRSALPSYRRNARGLGLACLLIALGIYASEQLPLQSYGAILLFAAGCCLLFLPLFFAVQLLPEKETRRLAAEKMRRISERLSDTLRNRFKVF